VSGSLPDGRVVIVGGRDTTNGTNGAYVSTAQIYTYDANLGSWSPEKTYGGEGQGRLWMLSAVLDDGSMVVGGGFSSTPQSYAFFAETDLLDPRGEWKTIGRMWPVRWGATLTPVSTGPGQRGAYLAAGGSGYSEDGTGVIGRTSLLTLATVEGAATSTPIAKVDIAAIRTEERLGPAGLSKQVEQKAQHVEYHARGRGRAQVVGPPEPRPHGRNYCA
jgi:hypothetical protein